MLLLLDPAIDAAETMGNNLRKCQNRQDGNAAR